VKIPNLALLRVVLFPDPILKRACSPVTEFGPELKALADRMLELMRAEKGVGLAAPQVGLSLRLFVCNPTGEATDDLVCVNPRFVELSGQAEQQEGCLSIPGVTVGVRRATRAVMEAHSVDGTRFEISAIDLPARIWQHETDHLDGKLIIDRMSEADELANRKALKQLRAENNRRRR